MKNVVLCDFDGTITSIDSCEIVLNRFAKGDWESYDEQLLRGEISLEECMKKQFQMIKASKAMILQELENYVFFRPNFKELVNYCRIKDIPFIIVSGGLDFVVRHFLKQTELEKYVEVVAAKTKFIRDSIILEFPTKLFDNSVDFK
jgi:2-hydroxy-3-keto-5-methylthiopentenyl-1-phosphate phosphatase